MFTGWSSTRFVFLVLIWNPTWLPGSIMCSHWLKFKKFSCQKPRSQLNCDFAGMIIGWSCTKFVNHLPIGNSRWPPWLDLVLHWTLWEFHIFIFFSETTKQIWTKLGRNVHWMVIYKIFAFGTYRKSNMAARAHNVFWLVEIFKIFLLETTKPIELWLCRNDHWVILY